MHRLLLFASGALAAACSPAVVLAQTPPVDPAAHPDATAAYQALAEGDAVSAATAAGRAVAAAPDNLEWRLLLVDALLASDEPARALAALQPVAGAWDHRVQTRRADAARRSGDLAQAAEAYGLAAPLAPTVETRAYLARSQVQVLVEAGRRAEARAALRGAHEAGILPGDAPLDAAYAAVSAGDDNLASRDFAAADRIAPLSGAQALDAAYAARRAGQDRSAAQWLERGARTLPADELTPRRRHEIGRELQTLEHRVGGSASVLTGPAASSTALLSTGGGTVTQAGAEVWTRLGGDNNGRPLQAFVRAYQTLDADTGAVGGDSTQGWVGLRWKPFTETNLVVEASRMVAMGDDARDDTMLRASWSGDIGGDLRFDRDSWPSAHVYVDAARLVEAKQDFAVVDGAIGWTWVASHSRRDLITAGVGLRADYDSARGDRVAVAAGPRLAWRRWMGGDAVRAPGRYLDLSVGYDLPLGDSPREKGFTAAMTFGF